MQLPISKHIVIPLVTGLMLGLSVTVFTFHLTCSTNTLSLHTQRSPNYDLNTSVNRDEDLVSSEMAEQVRMLCWIMTQPQNLKSKVKNTHVCHKTHNFYCQARHVKATWGRRCNLLLFMSSEADDDLPSVKLNVGEGRDNLWGKTKLAFRHVYQHHFEDYDWFVKADDDTYMIIENLRYLLKDQNSSHPIYFGRKFKPHVRQGWMSGGAGYVLSKEALRRLVEVIIECL